MPLLYVVIVLFIIYTFLILYYWQGWKSLPDYISTDHPLTTKISVIIPARNEEENIGNLLLALQEQTYPKELTEIIIVDDHSTDRTAEITKRFAGIKLLQLQDNSTNSYKKKAIETGIAAASGELIVTTDADCMPPEKWLQLMASFKEEKKSVFIAAPVSFTSKGNSLLSVFQQLDFLVLQGITGASVHRKIHSMCNGANLAYEHRVFNEVGGFSGIDNIASGDDMLLMHKIWKQHPSAVHFLKSPEAIVTTEVMKTWKAFFSQRIRWASKATNYDDKRIFVVLLLVYLFNFSFLILLIAGFFQPVYWLWLAALWLAKTAIELPLVYTVAVFFGRQSLIKYFFFFQPLHIIYTIVSGFFGQFGKYEWKGRKVR